LSRGTPEPNSRQTQTRASPRGIQPKKGKRTTQPRIETQPTYPQSPDPLRRLQQLNHPLLPLIIQHLTLITQRLRPILQRVEHLGRIHVLGRPVGAAALRGVELA
jgi:hypothetical protein